MNRKHFVELDRRDRRKDFWMISLILIAVLTLAPAAGSISAAGTEVFAKARENDDRSIEETINEIIPDNGGNDASEDGVTKNETSYVVMDADGKKKDVVVEEWLKNGDEEDTIEDESTLTDIENVSGDENFSRSGHDLTWAADGNDIKYRGSTDKELPVDVNVSYYLDGKKMKADEIKGKSGKVKIRFDYSVRARDTVAAKGGTYELFHPFIVVSGVMLPKDKFSSVEVSSGRTIGETDSVVCVGIALPGLKENLGMSSDGLDIPDSVVITADADDFELDGTYTVAMQGFPGDIKIGDKIGDTVDKVETSFDQLSDASAKLAKGTGALKSGISELAGGAGTLEIGSDKLRKGAKTLTKGTGSLYKGVKTLSKGTGELASGTAELDKKSKDLADGVETLYEGSVKLSKGSSALKEGTGSAEEGSKALSEGLKQLDQGSEAIRQGTKALVSQVFSGATAELQQMLIKGGLPEEQAKQYVLTEDSYEGTLSALSKALPPYADAFGKVKGELDQVAQYGAGVEEYLAGVKKAYDGSESLKEGVGKLTTGADSVDKGILEVSGGLSKLSGSMPELKKGVKALSDGAGKLDEGAKSLKKGSGKLNKGIKALYKGNAGLEDGLDKFASGTKKLNGGAGTLKKGMYKFDRDGIRKLVSSFDTGKITDISSRIDAISEAASRTFFMGGTKEGLSGESKLIFKTGEIK